MKAIFIALATALSLAAPAAQAEAAYPSKSIRFIVPFAPGGGGDIASRLVAQGMSRSLGQTVVVDNRAGAAGQLGTDIATKAAPDGYTIVFGSGGPLTVLPQFKQVPYDPLKDLAPVGMMATSDGIVVVGKDFPAKNAKEFIELLKANPGKYAYGSSGAGGPSHLSGERFQIATGTSLTHVGYKGDGPAINDLASGAIPIVFTVMASVMPQVNSGLIRAVAAYGPKRSALLPQLSTFAESGFPELTYGSWFAVFAPAGTPAPVVEKLNAALKSALDDPAISTRLATLGIEPAYSTAAHLARHTREEFEMWRKVIRERNLKIETN